MRTPSRRCTFPMTDPVLEDRSARLPLADGRPVPVLRRTTTTPTRPGNDAPRPGRVARRARPRPGLRRRRRLEHVPRRTSCPASRSTRTAASRRSRYVRRGLIDHSDSLGAAARFGRGDVQWLTAGGGIVHSEMFPLLDRDAPNPLELFQIWLNLPGRPTSWSTRTSRCCGTRTSRGTWSTDADGRTTDGHRDRRRARRTHGRRRRRRTRGRRGPTPTSRSGTSHLEPGARWHAAAGRAAPTRCACSTCSTGCGARRRPRRSTRPPARVLRADVTVTIDGGPDGVEVLVLQGRPIGEPVAQYGPFVMNTDAEIQQAFADYRRTGFGGWPWPADDPVHGRAADASPAMPTGTLLVPETAKPGRLAPAGAVDGSIERSRD